MDSNIYIIDKGSSVLLVDLHSLHTCEVSKEGLTKEVLQRKVDEVFSDQRPYFERLQPRVDLKRKRNAVIVPSFACNYSCEYCYQKPSKSIYDRLIPEDIDSIYRFFRVFCERNDIPLAFDRISVMGGEPLLLENREVLQKIAMTWPECTIAITTNGSTLLEYEDYLTKDNIKIIVSLDGTEKTHYLRRKTNDPSAYRRAIEGIRHLLEKGKSIQVNTLFSPENIDDYSQFFDEMEALGWSQDEKSKVKLVFAPEIVCGNDSRKYSRVMAELEAFVALRRRDPRAGAVNAVQLLPGAESLLNALNQASQGFYVPYRCGILTSGTFAFRPDGYVMPCMGVQDKKFSVGQFKPNVEFNESLIAVLSKRRIDKTERCQSCTKSVLCRGGCVATVLAEKGDPTALYCDIWESLEYMKYFEAVVP